MKIFIFDDNAIHRAAAEAQLKGHDLTVVGTYDEALRSLTNGVDYEKERKLLVSQFGKDFSPWSYPDGSEERLAYKKAEDLAHEQATYQAGDYDVVMTDLLVPASGNQLPVGSKLVGQEMPVGIFIGLLAAVKARVKHVAVFTDSDHHSHPASACFDAFNMSEYEPTAFTVEQSKVLLCNSRGWIGTYDPSDYSTELSYEESRSRQGSVRAKNWAALLEYLLKV